MLTLKNLFGALKRRPQAAQAAADAPQYNMQDTCPLLDADFDIGGSTMGEYDHWVSVILARTDGDTFDPEKVRKASRAIRAVSRAAERATAALYELDAGKTPGAGVPAAVMIARSRAAANA